MTLPVVLYAAASTSNHATLHILNCATGNRLNHPFVYAETGETVERDAQVKGYEVAPDDFVILEPDEIAATVPDNDKTLTILHFVLCVGMDDVYFDKPDCLAPSNRDAFEPFALLTEGMRVRKVAALSPSALFRRVRTMLIWPDGAGLVGTTLNFDCEASPAAEALADAPKIKIAGEMLDLARHIIDTKKGSCDPATFDDRYEAALADRSKRRSKGARRS